MIKKIAYFLGISASISSIYLGYLYCKNKKQKNIIKN